MYAIKNKVQLIGNLGRAPEIRTTESGKKMARFSVATDDFFRNSKGERVKETLWHTVVAWGKLADFAEKSLTKGTEVVLSGKLTHREYIDKKGIKRLITEIVMNELVIVGGGTRHQEENEVKAEDKDFDSDTDS